MAPQMRMNGFFLNFLVLCHRNDEPSQETTFHSSLLQLPQSREIYFFWTGKQCLNCGRQYEEKENPVQ